MDNVAFDDQEDPAPGMRSIINDVTPMRSKSIVAFAPHHLDVLERRESDNSVESKETCEPEEKPWHDYSKAEKYSYLGFAVIKMLLFIFFLYFFLLSLNFMTIGFTLVSGVAMEAGDTIRFILSNPFASLAIGIIVTAIMQNATATTSIAVSMVGAGIIPDVKNAIPIIMGSNIGTCFTNSLIALTLAGDPNEFKRAFSGATLNDMFNFLTTAVLLPIEILFDVLYTMSDKLTSTIPFENADQIAQANFIGAILNPFTDLFIVLDNDAIDAITKGDRNVTEIARRCCERATSLQNQTASLTSSNMTYNTTVLVNKTICMRECSYWCVPMLRSFGDAGTGLFWIVLSIVVLIVCLFSIVKVLSLLIVGPIAKGVRRGLNASLPGKMKWLTQVILFVIAFLLTLIVQSSNIITATLVPLCGIGLISLQRVYVMTLGSNIGTTVTGILSAFTLTPNAMKKGLQLAFVYTFFNTLGVIFWLPIPFLRFPKTLARHLGNIVFQYRWFLYVYAFSVYFVIPIIIFCLALIPYWIGLAIVGLPLICLCVSYLVVLILRKYCIKVLPVKLKSFSWLPIWLRSLEPYDTRMKQMSCCDRKNKQRVHAEQMDFIITSVGFDLEKGKKGLSNRNDQQTQTDSEEGKVSTPRPIPSVIRRMSVIGGLVREGERKVRSRRNSYVSNLSSSEDEHDLQSVKDYRLRRSFRRSKISQRNKELDNLKIEDTKL
jgi:sodium-dependent phosphate cotransporter